MIKDMITSAASFLGYSITPKWRLERLEFAQHLKRIFELRNVNCVLDVGANIGQYRDFIRQEVEYSGAIISFEPVRKTFDILSARAKDDPNWIVSNCAIGEFDGKMEINVMAGSALNSFLEPDVSRHNLVNNVVMNKETVAIRRLDTIVKELASASKSNIYLKMDTQGYDLQAFIGAGKLTDRIVALQSEMSVIPIYQNMPGYMESIEHFQSNGFLLSGMYPVNLNNALQLVEFDCVMINNKFEG